MFRRPSSPTTLAALLVALTALLVGVPPQAAAAPTDACGVRPAKGLGYWSCTFVDNFGGTSVDRSRWNSQDTAISNFFLGRTCFRAGTQTRVADGQLRLTVSKKTPFPCPAHAGAFSTKFLGADINTWGKFSQTTGRFEARIKFPSYTRAGYHGGFWLNPQDQAYGSWPLSGEIDIAEWWSSTADRAYPTLHYLGSTVNDTGRNCLIGKASDFHRYAVEWTALSITFKYDGKTCFQRTLTPTLLVPLLPFDKRFFISLTFGEGYPVGSATAATPFPASMVVDYVRVWK